MVDYIQFEGMRIPILFGLSAMEQCEAEYGSMRELQKQLRDRKGMLKATVTLFRAMAMCAMQAQGIAFPELDPHWLDWMSVQAMISDPKGYGKNTMTLMGALSRGYYSEKRHREEEEDPFLAEARANRARKGKGTGVSARDLYSMALICGISLQEARTVRPGFVIDMYQKKTQYDANYSAAGAVGAMFGGKRRKR